jgi:hypothetical protein
VISGSGIVTLAVALLLVAALAVAGSARATAATLANTNNQAHDLDDRGQIVGLYERGAGPLATWRPYDWLPGR